MLFPYPPNWASPFKVTREFVTKIVTSRSGKEQRRASRNRPRKRVEFSVTLSEADALGFRRRMQKYAGLDITIADETRFVRSTATLAAGNTAISVPSVPSWMFGPVVLRYQSRAELADVFSTGSGVVTLAGASTVDWPAGTSILPALTGRLDPSVEATLVTDSVLEASVMLRVNPLSEPEFTPPLASLTFNGREVFLAKPNWLTAPTAVFANPYETVDYGYGAIAHFNPVAFVSRTQQATYLALDPAAVADIENLFIRSKGQRGEFYMPTWLNDLPPLGTAASGVSAFTVAGTDAATLLNGDTTLKAICVRYRDGTFKFYKVTSLTVSGSNSVVSLGSALTRDIDSTVAAISWMPAHRFASDLLTSEWVVNTIARLQMSAVTLEDLP